MTSCHAISSRISYSVVIASRVPLIIADMLLIYITWTRLNGREFLKTGLQQSGRVSLPHVFIRDGMLVAQYFKLSMLTELQQGLYTLCRLDWSMTDHNKDGF